MNWAFPLCLIAAILLNLVLSHVMLVGSYFGLNSEFNKCLLIFSEWERNISSTKVFGELRPVCVVLLDLNNLVRQSSLLIEVWRCLEWSLIHSFHTHTHNRIWIFLDSVYFFYIFVRLINYYLFWGFRRGWWNIVLTFN